MTKKKQPKNNKKKFSKFYKIWVRPSIVKEFTQGNYFDDMMAGLHEIRAQMTEKAYANKLAKKAK